MKNEITIGTDKIGDGHPVYFIADIAANHDGDLQRAKLLITLAKQSGANAVKFQHHDVKKYVSDYGFKSLGDKFSHQAKWEKTIFEVYKDAQVPKSWSDELVSHCKDLGITFFTTPYDLDAVDYMDKYVPAFKIGSGDVSWNAMLQKIANTNKPILLATGASTIQEVIDSVGVISSSTKNFVLMQCNTNYTGSYDNFKFINLNVLKLYKTLFPNLILGLSDHTPGGVTVLGAVSLGAKVIEKHFTDDTSRDGPDHPFSMDPCSWKKMVEDTRILEQSLGHCIKKVEENEFDTVILQRRAIRVINKIKQGNVITEKDIEFQRPCPSDAISINNADIVVGKKAKMDIDNGDYLREEHFYD